MTQTQTQTQTTLESVIIHDTCVVILTSSDSEPGYTDSVVIDREGIGYLPTDGSGYVCLPISQDSKGILRKVLPYYGSWVRSSYRSGTKVVITPEDLARADSDRIQSLLILCDSIRESTTDSRILEILDSIQAARLVSV